MPALFFVVAVHSYVSENREGGSGGWLLHWYYVSVTVSRRVSYTPR